MRKKMYMKDRVVLYLYKNKKNKKFEGVMYSHDGVKTRGK